MMNKLTVQCDFCNGKKRVELSSAKNPEPSIEDCPKCKATGELSLSLKEIQDIYDSIEYGEWVAFNTITLDLTDARILVLLALEQAKKSLPHNMSEEENEHK